MGATTLLSIFLLAYAASPAAALLSKSNTSIPITQTVTIDGVEVYSQGSGHGILNECGFRPRRPPIPSSLSNDRFPAETMGAGASAGLKAATMAATDEELSRALKALGGEEKEKLRSALAACQTNGDAPKEEAAKPKEEEPTKEEAPKEEKKDEAPKE